MKITHTSKLSVDAISRDLGEGIIAVPGGIAGLVGFKPVNCEQLLGGSVTIWNGETSIPGDRLFYEDMVTLIGSELQSVYAVHDGKIIMLRDSLPESIQFSFYEPDASPSWLFTNGVNQINPLNMCKDTFGRMKSIIGPALAGNIQDSDKFLTILVKATDPHIEIELSPGNNRISMSSAFAFVNNNRWVLSQYTRWVVFQFSPLRDYASSGSLIYKDQFAVHVKSVNLASGKKTIIDLGIKSINGDFIFNTIYQQSSQDLIHSGCLSGVKLSDSDILAMCD